MGTGDIVAVFDANPHKQDHYMPGSHIPIHAPVKVDEIKPDYLLILPWNLREEIAEQMADVTEHGTLLVVPVPRVEVLA